MTNVTQNIHSVSCVKIKTNISVGRKGSSDHFLITDIDIITGDGGSICISLFHKDKHDPIDIVYITSEEGESHENE